MEEELRRSKGLMEAVTQGTGVIMATLDPNYHYTYFNQAYREEIKRLVGADYLRRFGQGVSEKDLDIAVAGYLIYFKSKGVLA
jgi:hypothetical protein